MLAAGASTRLGKPKQLLQFQGKSLLRHTVEEAINANPVEVIVILGQNAELIASEVDSEKAHIIENKNWKEGMSSAIRLGLYTLLAMQPSVETAILMVCDQPFISNAVLNELMTTYQQSKKPIIVCNYGDAIGPPALFHRSLFNELMQLKGDMGARSIIRQHKDEMANIQFPKGSVDIDKQEDYEKLLNVQ